jgi:purine-binding chemotaxis protein CheW
MTTPTDRRAGGAQPPTPSRNFTIKVRAQTFGVPVDCVKTVFHVDVLTPVPLAPREIAGLANLRGRIVTAVHLDRCLKLDDGDRPPTTLAVGIEHHGEKYALLIDETGDVVTCDDKDRIVCPTHIGAQLAETTGACYRIGDGFLPILDIDALVRRMSRLGESGGQRDATGGSDR